MPAPTTIAAELVTEYLDALDALRALEATQPVTAWVPMTTVVQATARVRSAEEALRSAVV